ncbi:MAG: hypothetical protein L0Z62_34225, partial [Gemmataceae bacterium]|nr:hypothetical protein [Gemmataceae bacterium]
MTQNQFDQASRYLAKLDPLGFLCWLLRLLNVEIRFHGWLDTRTIPFPGDPDRTCDTVACVSETTLADLLWALVLEFQLEPDPDMFGRLLCYLGSVWLERRPPGPPGTRYLVGAVVVNLTGQRRTASRDMRLGIGLRTCFLVPEINLAEESASATLGGIKLRQLPACLFPLVPL